MDERADRALVELQRRQASLHQREREIVETACLRRINGFESIRDATRRLAEIGSASGILARAAVELGTNSRFDRLLISEVVGGQLVPRVIWERDNEKAGTPETVELGYPMVEYEMAQHRVASAQVVLGTMSRTPQQLMKSFAWTSYGVGTIAADGRAIGLLHADADHSGRPLDDIDSDLIMLSCAGLGELFERATLREALDRHRSELQSAASWLGTRLRATSGPVRAGRAVVAQAGELVVVDALTPREHEILSLLGRGQTNGQIASTLLIKEGTVKYHVKNVLRKLGARSRADAVARFARSAGMTPR